MPLSNNKIGYPNLTELTDNEWHTGNKDDPWRWCIRIERDNYALFGKFFFGKPGFIAADRITDFASVRRDGMLLNEIYFDGVMPIQCKRIFETIEDMGVLAVHEIKTVCCFDKSSNTKFENAMNHLQIYMLITTNEQKRKINL